MDLSQNKEMQKEERQNLLWKVLIAVSSLLLIGIAAYFIYQMFTSNPLEGVWSYEDSNLVMTIKDGNTVELELSDYFEGGSATVVMYYEVNVDAKTLTLHMNEEAVKAAQEQSGGNASSEEIRSVAGALEGAYNYNIEQNQLTLTEREYGEQMVFDRQ